MGMGSVCTTGQGQTKHLYTNRYIGSMVGDVHRTLIYGNEKSLDLLLFPFTLLWYVSSTSPFHCPLSSNRSGLFFHTWKWCANWFGFLLVFSCFFPVLFSHFWLDFNFFHISFWWWRLKNYHWMDTQGWCSVYHSRCKIALHSLRDPHSTSLSWSPTTTVILRRWNQWCILPPTTWHHVDRTWMCDPTLIERTIHREEPLGTSDTFCNLKDFKETNICRLLSPKSLQWVSAKGQETTGSDSLQKLYIQSLYQGTCCSGILFDYTRECC